MTNKLLFVADTTKAIKDTDEYPVTEEMIDKLDNMLNEYGVTHFFTLPIDSTDGVANDAEDLLNVFYDSKDDLLFNLVYALWCKAIRRVKDEKLYKALSRIAKRGVKEELGE